MKKLILLILTTLLSGWTLYAADTKIPKTTRPMRMFSYTDSIAKGGSYIFGCDILTTPGDYYEIHPRATYDSIVALTLTEYNPVPPCEEVTFAYADSVETGGTYIFNCRVLTEAGEYRDTLAKADGCDSIVVLTLTEYTPPVPPCEEVTFAYADSVETGGTYIFNCRVLTAAGIYRDTLAKADGCDSIVVLTLTEYTPIIPCEEVTFAYADSVETGGMYIFNCRVLTAAGTYKDTLIKADGCDSIVVLTLTEYTPIIPCEEVTFAYADSVETGGKYIFNCRVLTAAGTYKDTLVKADGCDSIVVLTLTEYTPPVPPCEEVTFAYADSVETGGTYIFNCRVLTAAGTYKDTLIKADGCDSIVVLTLTEYTPIIPCEDVTFAYADSVETGGMYIFNCRVLTAAGTYKDTLIKADGCDSIVVLTLTEYTPVIPCEDVTFAYADSVETGGTYIFNCRVLTEAGIYRDTLVKADGCDSIVVLTLTEYTPIIPCEDVTFAYADSVETGGTYIFNCRVLTAAGTYKDTLIKADGCDSIVVLTLTEYTPIIPCEEVTFAYADSVETGGTYIFNCRVLTEAGIYRDTLVKADGCDSIVVLTLTEYTPPVPPCEEVTFAYADSVETGGTYIFNCRVLTEAGTYRDTLVKADGCDSIVVLTLTEYTPYIPPVVVHDTVYQDSTNVEPFPYEYVFVSRLQTVTLHQDTTFADTIRDIPMSEVLIRDSIYRYFLTVLPKPQPVVVHDTVIVDSIDAFCRGTIFVSRLQTITLNQDTAFADTIRDIQMSDLLIRDSIYTYQLTALIPTTGDTTAYVCQGDDFYWHGAIAVDGDTWTTTNVAGCDSVVTLHLIPQPTSVDTLPAFAKDNNWLLMLGRKQVRDAYRLEPTEDQVLWYKVGSGSDKFLGTGYYYTEGQALVGDYYAKITGIDLSPLGACVTEARTITLHCGPANLTPRLAPTIVGAGQPMELSNLDPNEESQIVIYNVAGSVIRQFRVQGNETFRLTADETSGLYLLHVENGHQSTTLKYIVNP